MELLQIKNVSKNFGKKQVLKDLSFSVPEHSIFGFIGKNGSGKTTTMKMILGLLKIDDGEIYINGEKVVYGESNTNQYIGYLPDVPTFYDFMTAYEYLFYCGELNGLSKIENKQRCEELLKLVGLAQETHRIKGFSRGMKQRLGIAQALMNRPQLLICDEPTSALDPLGRKELLDLLLSLKEQTTILFSTHILADVERICSDVAFFNDGKIQMQGKIADLKERHRQNEYVLEIEKEEDTLKLLLQFQTLQREQNQLMFKGNEHELTEIIQFMLDHQISFHKIERLEPTLESLFMEVVAS